MSNRKNTPPQSLRASDPFLTREQGKYENPLPSREMVLSVLETAGVPVFEDDLARQLDIAESETEHFSRRLAAMERDGQIMRNRKGALCLVEKLDLIKGRVQGHPDGFGFVVPDDGSDDLFLGPKQMQKVLHGDRVMVREIGVDRKGRREASIVEVIEHVNERVVGRLFIEHNILFLVAENKRISQDILIEPGYAGGAQAGQVVVAQLVAQPSRNSEPVGRVIEVLGNYADPGMEIEIALRKHDLPHEFPEDVLAQEEKLPKKVLARDLKDREDLRTLPFVTIDGETAKDFDDAVYCEKRGKGFQLWVAIADVSHYVKPGDAFDRESIKRGNSVYFPRRVIPMLPESLSNGLCSLKPEVDRLVMVCEMSIGGAGPNAGQIKNYRFYPAVIHSQARLTYTKVWNYLSAADEAARSDSGVPQPLQPHIDALYGVYQVLLKERAKRGAIDFESAETIMQFDDMGKIEKIVPSVRNDAHRLIEECMLAANVCTAKFILENGHEALYRIHEPPNPEKLEVLRTFLRDFALSLPGGEEPEAREYSQLIDKIKTRPDGQLLQTVMLRSLMQAVYSPDNCGHFGLAYDAYTHFTSPIRRYPDLLVHRVIKAILAGENYNPGRSWHELGSQCSMTERRADEATRDVVSWLKCYFMKDRLGESFAGTISSVTSFGLFVSLDEVFVEGLVHISDLGQDYFHFDAKRHLMSGERSGKRFRLGDRVVVRVARVDLETSRIDFALDDHTASSTRQVLTLTRAPEPPEESAAEPVPQPAHKQGKQGKQGSQGKQGRQNSADASGAKPPKSGKGAPWEKAAASGKSRDGEKREVRKLADERQGNTQSARSTQSAQSTQTKQTKQTSSKGVLLGGKKKH